MVEGIKRQSRENRRMCESVLYADSDLSVFAVVDPARWRGAIPFLEDLAEDTGVSFCCLHTGALDPEVRAVSPHIVELPEDTDAYEQLMPELWGDARGILLSARGGLRDVQAHLRSLAYAEMPDGEITLFRFYDPRALGNVSAVFTDEQRAALFGEIIARIVFEDADGDVCVLMPGHGAVTPALAIPATGDSMSGSRS